MIRALPRFLKRLRHSRRGATIIEFAFVAPVMCILLMGAFDLAHTLFVRTALDGIVQKAARDSALEDGSSSTEQAQIDAKVRDQVKSIVNTASVDFTRRYYRTFADAAAAKPEKWTDTNHNGVCDNSEPYDDTNNNSIWDADGGNEGQGGAKDATLYTVTVTYTRVFPAASFLGLSDKVTLSTATVLRNQPYGDQGSYGAVTARNCTPDVLAPPDSAPTPTPTPTATSSSTPTPTPSPTGSGGDNGGNKCTISMFGICLI